MFSFFHLYSFKTNVFNGTTVCLPNQNYELFEIHSLFLIFYQFFVPLVIISITYSRIIYKLFFQIEHTNLRKNKQEDNKKNVFLIKNKIN